MLLALFVVLFASTVGPSATSQGAASWKRDSRHMRARAEVEVVAARALALASPPSAERIAQPPRTAVPAARPIVLPPKVELPDFRASLERAAESLPICRHGVEGPSSAEVTFLPDGSARVALAPPYAHTETGACIARRLARAAAPFEGDPVTERVRFAL